MKNPNKLLALTLALALVFALTACGSEPKGSVTPDKGAASPEPANVPENTPEPEDDVEPGSINGGTYENSFAGIGCRLDNTWTYYSEEEILQLNELVAGAIDDEELAGQLRGGGSFYDMLASDYDGSSINVVLDRLGLIYGRTLDAGGYIDIALESLERQLALMGVSVAACEKTSFDFCGGRTDGIYIAGTVSIEGIEVDMYQRMACVKAGGYMTCVTSCSYFEDITTDLLDMFYAL